MSLIIFIIICISATNIIVNEYVFHWLRSWVERVFPYSALNKMLNCEVCMGFHVGWILALLFPSLGVSWFIGALISSIVNKTYVLLLLKF